MAKTTDYSNITYNDVLVPIRSLLRAQYNPNPVYIAPFHLDQADDLSIRVWSDRNEFLSIYSNTAFSRRIYVDIVQYHTIRNPKEHDYEYIYREMERTTQLMTNNHAYDAGSDSDVTSWIEGKIEEIEIENVNNEGLVAVNFLFTCIISRQ